LSDWPTFISDNTKKVSLDVFSASTAFLFVFIISKPCLYFFAVSSLGFVLCEKLQSARVLFFSIQKKEGNLVSPSETRRHEFEYPDTNHGSPS
jgi:hypothetical protein